MKLSLKPQHLKRYKDIAMLFWKYGTSDLATEFAHEADGDEKAQLAAKPGQPAPEDLADDLERMGPTFIKFGQLLSSRPDLLPEHYLKALARLQDEVNPSFAKGVKKLRFFRNWTHDTLDFIGAVLKKAVL